MRPRTPSWTVHTSCGSAPISDVIRSSCLRCFLRRATSSSARSPSSFTPQSERFPSRCTLRPASSSPSSRSGWPRVLSAVKPGPGEKNHPHAASAHRDSFVLPVLLGAMLSRFLLRDAAEAFQLAALALVAGMLLVAAAEEIIGEAHEARGESSWSSASFCSRWCPPVSRPERNEAFEAARHLRLKLFVPNLRDEL